MSMKTCGLCSGQYNGLHNADSCELLRLTIGEQTLITNAELTNYSMSLERLCRLYSVTIATAICVTRDPVSERCQERAEYIRIQQEHMRIVALLRFSIMLVKK
jgi:hypothetical protein